MGVVSKNSILLVEYAIEARPIIMTKIAMAGGMLPAALSLISGELSFRQPMGMVIIGGLITSTFLSLIAIPVVYIFADDFTNMLRRPFKAVKTDNAQKKGELENSKYWVSQKRGRKWIRYKP